ncbi:hypothetical protein GOODEAATRI_034524 [Goodea atripinnis]|uniref:Uncharacterized protein n=1 Tax=Goodea atripinnis TaxID=208336 RepID=A0ABV0N0L7_9TELE
MTFIDNRIASWLWPLSAGECLKAKLVQHYRFEVLASRFPRPQFKHVSVGSSMDAAHINYQDLKDLLPTSWCQIPLDILRGLVESRLQWVRAVRQLVILLCLISTYNKQLALLFRYYTFKVLFMG